MAKAGIEVQLSISDIYEQLCPACKRKLRELIKEQITDRLVSQVVGQEP